MHYPEYDLKNIGILPFLESGTRLAIAHKLGGDNMGLLEANRRVIDTLTSVWVTQTFSVSAFRSSTRDFNTTSKLIKAWESQNQKVILDTLSEIQAFHSGLLEDILHTAPENLRTMLLQYAHELFETYKAQSLESDFKNCTSFNDYTLWVGKKVFSLLSIGEVIAAKVFVEYLKAYNIPAVFVDIDTLKDISPSELSQRSEAFLTQAFEKIFTNNSEAIPIVPGYIGGIQGWILEKLGRGYTDFTGSRSAVALYDMKQFGRVLLYIQKLYGFKSTDPRILWDNPENAKSLNHLSYHLTQRAIGHRGAGAGLINPYSLDERIRNRNIPLLVWNPTDTNDIALIDQFGNQVSRSVDLVLGRDYNGHDALRFGIQHQVWNISEERHMVYLMGENIENIALVYQQAREALRKNKIEEIAGKLTWNPYKELTLIFSDKQTAQRAQRVLHEVFVEKR
jgi:aspartokinase